MDLIRRIEGILECSEGMKPLTRDNALKETIEYYRKYQQGLIDSAKEKQSKENSNSEFYIRFLEAEKVLLEKVLKGKTTYQQEISQLSTNSSERLRIREKDPLGPYTMLEFIIIQYFSMFFDENEKKTIAKRAEIIDNTIRRLYLSKHKKKYNPEV
jgi:hypothetical protein